MREEGEWWRGEGEWWGGEGGGSHVYDSIFH